MSKTCPLCGREAESITFMGATIVGCPCVRWTFPRSSMVVVDVSKLECMRRENHDPGDEDRRG